MSNCEVELDVGYVGFWDTFCSLLYVCHVLFSVYCIVSFFFICIISNKECSKKKKRTVWLKTDKVGWQCARDCYEAPELQLNCNSCHTAGRSSGFYFVLSCHLLFYFERLTFLSFQVTYPSSCVASLIVYPDSRLSPPVPHFPPSVLIVCVSLCPVPVCSLPSLCSCVHPCLTTEFPSLDS